jgi:hypothetical protein
MPEEGRQHDFTIGHAGALSNNFPRPDLKDIGSVKPPGSSHEEIIERLGKMESKIDDIGNALELIFGSAVLVNGRFVNLNIAPSVTP